MKTALIASAVILSSLVAQAKTIASSDLKVAPSSVSQNIILVDKKSEGDLKINIIVTDSGMSTDVSPRYTVYLGFASFAEMGNLSADFQITNTALQFISATRAAAGIYVVKTLEMKDDGGLIEVTRTIDTNDLFVAEKQARKACGDDFCDQVLKANVSVSETSKPGKW